MLKKPKKIQKIYMDHAASAPMDKRVFETMKPFFVNDFGNPSAIYSMGRKAQKAINDARKSIALNMRALPENIIFTSGGTEANNLAIFGTAKANAHKGKHIITTTIEHHSVSEPIKELKKDGFEITEVPVDKNGIVSVDKIIQSIRPDTILITVIFANNEVGSIQPIAEIGRQILKYRKQNESVYPFFMSDACQAAGYLDLDVEKIHLDLMVINASKIYGPKGVGALYLRRGVAIAPIIFGGGQEKGKRSGTEKVASIFCFAKAFELCQLSKSKESARLKKLSQYFCNQLQKNIDKISLNGPEIGESRLPNNINIAFYGVEGEAMLLYLDEYGITCSTGSACSSESLEPSHVLLAMGQSREKAHGSLRFSLGKSNNKSQIDYIIKYLPQIIKQLREMSPLK